MFKREMKVNFKSFIIWLLVLLGIFLMGFLIYPSIVKSDSVSSLNEMMGMFPEEVLKAFNMDISSIDSVFGWIKSEGFVLVLLIVGCYAGVMGSSILYKEEDDGTIEYLNSLPVRRCDIVYSKMMSGFIYIILMVLGLGIFNYIGLSISGDFDRFQYILLSITPIFSSIVIYFLCMFLSVVIKKGKKLLGLSLGLVLVSYVLEMFSNLSDGVSFLKYFSVFTLADIRNVIIDVSLNPVLILISISLSILFGYLTLVFYNKREFL